MDWKTKILTFLVQSIFLKFDSGQNILLWFLLTFYNLQYNISKWRKKNQMFYSVSIIKMFSSPNLLEIKNWHIPEKSLFKQYAIENTFISQIWDVIYLINNSINVFFQKLFIHYSYNSHRKTAPYLRIDQLHLTESNTLFNLCASVILSSQ